MQKETPLKDQFHQIFGRYGATRLFVRQDAHFAEVETFTGNANCVITRSRRDGIFRLYDEETRDIRLFRASNLSHDVTFDDMDSLFERLLWLLKEQDALPFGADLYVVGPYIGRSKLDLELIAYTLTRLGDLPIPEELIRELCHHLVA
ncbi:hypothetical protein [Exiguobacterium algae]|uniref:hypothetical protein n=1 Tax=Exiguobacterium algae TaxID=2751250 RepID=UPI001BEB2823|nr:hypothetical protein [Exiguobacterium algae]